MENKQIVFTSKNVAEYITVPLRRPDKGEVLVRTAVSTLSNGTEKSLLTGDPVVSIFSHEGDPVVFPRSSGYSSTGIVEEVGEGVTSVVKGDRVAMSWSSHAVFNTLSESNILPLPDGVSFQEGAFCHIVTFPMAAIRKVRLEIGESLMVMGLGILGLLAVQTAKAAGAVPVIAVDPNAKRRNKALAMGADYALDPLAEGFSDEVKRLTGGGAATAIEVTGLGVGLNQCLDCMRKMGRIALLGCTRDKNFTVDYYRKIHGPGITLVGAHTLARPQWESSEGWFTCRDDMQAVLRLMDGKRLCFSSFVDQTVLPQDCAKVYEKLIADPDFPPVTQFDWQKA